MPELFGLCVRAETKNKVKSIEISLEQTAADEVKDQYANEYGICIHDTNEWLLVDPTFNSDGDFERFFWKKELEDHNIEIDIVRIRAMTNCCRKFKTM